MPRKPILFGGGGVAALIVGAAIYFFVLPSSGAASESEAAEPPPEPTPVRVEGKLGPHIVFEERVFTLESPSDQPRYLKLEIVIEFETFDEAWFALSGEPLYMALEEFDEEIGSGRALIEDAFTTIVSGKSIADVATPEGKEKLRAELRHAVAELIEEPAVRRVLFTDFITQ